MAEYSLGTQASLQACLLAAGFSKRFGSAKLLALMPDGRRLIDHSLAVYLRLNIPLTVFLRQDDHALQKHLDQYPVEQQRLSNVEEGLSVSVRAAASYVQSGKFTHGLFALADMPFLSAHNLNQFLKKITWQAPAIAAPFSQKHNRLGNPVVFHRDFLSDFDSLKGDQGAKPILHKHSGLLNRVLSEDEGFYRDIDTRADLAEH